MLTEGGPGPRFVAFQNGEFVNIHELQISVFDSALMFGDMVFEMTRSFQRKHFMLEEHLDRLFLGLKILQIDPRLTKETLMEICTEVATRNEALFLPTDEHRLMINVSRGPLGIYSEVFEGVLEPTIVVADIPLRWSVSGLGQLFDIGINAVITSQRAIPARYMDPKIKNRSRLFYQMANIEASRFRGDNNWALLLDEHGNIAEGTGDNFFLVKDGRVLSPKGKDILRGISRQYIQELCEHVGIPYLETDIDPYDAYSADEAFISGTPFCILPVSSINYVSTNAGSEAPITRRLLARWSENVGVDISAQIKSFNEQSPQRVGLTPYNFK